MLANLPADIDAELVSLRFLALKKNCYDTLIKLKRDSPKCISFQTEQAFITAFELSEHWIIMLGNPASLHSQLSISEKYMPDKTPSTGKFLLKQSDIEQLQKISESEQSELRTRMLTIEASEDLQTLLVEIGSLKGVLGCLIVGHDGLLIANTMPEEVDAESIGVWCLGEYMNTEHVMKKMGHERVHQIVNRTARGCIVVAEFGGGLLVAIIEEENLVEVMRKITDLVS